ncbi:MAG: 50S ribosomal protein L34 [Candidatus Levybacteria bacterium RIFCSPHIGHO2_01_FULL_40_10]|nr:MAG: 50S ribosomal protein L34 [Candidatus Levybacteria bacterium RIFCSPHIGHO2_01_FULL_40_10]
MPELLKKSSKIKHARKHGFRSRIKKRTGKQVIKRRRLKGRRRV